jgi:hypothetical protein
MMGILASAGVVCAQNGRGTWSWQVSTDDGGSWRSGAVEVPSTQDHVRCRVLMAWTPDAGYAFSGTQFDATVTGHDGAGAADTISGIARPYPYNSGTNQTLVATRFGATIKIDDARDTAGPGMGTRGVFPGQGPQDFPDMSWSQENPTSLFEFDLNLDGSLGRRTFDEFFLAPTGLPRILIYTTSSGATNALTIPSQVSFVDAEVVVVPAPGFIGMAAGLAGWSVRRRRR